MYHFIIEGFRTLSRTTYFLKTSICTYTVYINAESYKTWSHLLVSISSSDTPTSSLATEKRNPGSRQRIRARPIGRVSCLSIGERPVPPEYAGFAAWKAEVPHRSQSLWFHNIGASHRHVIPGWSGETFMQQCLGVQRRVSLAQDGVGKHALRKTGGLAS
jgi:hypothetical protein